MGPALYSWSKLTNGETQNQNHKQKTLLIQEEMGHILCSRGKGLGEYFGNQGRHTFNRPGQGCQTGLLPGHNSEISTFLLLAYCIRGMKAC